MGNFWIPEFPSSSSSPSSTIPSSPSNEKGKKNEQKKSNYLMDPGITKSTSNERTHSGTGSAFSSSLKIFSFAELKKATRNFQSDAVVGEGCFGTVFKGWIDEKTFAPTKAGSGMAIAVKKLNSVLRGRDEWQSEVNILGSLSHPNLVRLLGHCEEDEELLLVYEFMPRGSLANHLFSRGSAFQPLSWSIRLKIAIGAARCLAFLHCWKIIYRNLTPYNILLDSNYNAKISNFGLASNGALQGKNSHVSTCVICTYGYADPEFVAAIGHLYMKSDVYSFGVVLLEMLSGKPAPYANCNCLRGQRYLVNWARIHLSYWMDISRVMDRQLEGQYPPKGADRAAKLILKCLSPHPPSMTKVAEALEEIQAPKHP